MAKRESKSKLPKGITYRENKGLFMWRFMHEGTSYCGYTKTLTEAKTKLADMKYEVTHDKYRKEVNDTLDSWFEEWLVTYKHRKASTMRTYTQTYKGIISPVFGKSKLKNIKKEQAQRFANHVAKNYSKSTAQASLRLLNECLERAKKNGMINKNPMDDIETPSFNKSEKVRALTAEQERTFFEYIKDRGVNYYPIYRTLDLSGMRIGECLALSWDNVDFDNESIWIKQNLCYTPQNGLYLDTPKSESSIRRLRMKKGGELYNLLKTQRIAQFEQRAKAQDAWETVKGFENLVFLTECGKPHFACNIREKLYRIINRMQKEGYDVPDFKLHTLRHCYATRWLENGGDPKVLQKALGHSTFAITMDTYGDVMDDTLNNEMDKVALALAL